VLSLSEFARKLDDIAVRILFLNSVRVKVYCI